MKSQTALLLLYSALFVNGLDDYEERRIFHEWLCRKRPSLQGCSKPFTIQSYKKELKDHTDKEALLLSQKSTPISKRSSKKDPAWYDIDDDEDYEYYLWKKYRREKLRKALEGDGNSGSTRRGKHRHNDNDRTNLYYSTSYYDYNHPTYQYSPTYPSSYSSGYSYGYPAYRGSYCCGFSGLGGGLFGLGIGSGIGIFTPIGNVDIFSGFGIGIG